mmetsp:Transcript_2144/g.6533  ORF Transcript_2144/g.6533 Transcript_2144/m.6533 type:complete len:232 (+) Transcript_2144:2774-3469(+)
MPGFPSSMAYAIFSAPLEAIELRQRESSERWRRERDWAREVAPSSWIMLSDRSSWVRYKFLPSPLLRLLIMPGDSRLAERLRRARDVFLLSASASARHPSSPHTFLPAPQQPRSREEREVFLPFRASKMARCPGGPMLEPCRTRVLRVLLLARNSPIKVPPSSPILLQLKSSLSSWQSRLLSPFKRIASEPGRMPNSRSTNVSCEQLLAILTRKLSTGSCMLLSFPPLLCL